MISMIVDGTVGTNTEVPCGFDRVYICSDEKELPAILFLFVLDHPFTSSLEYLRLAFSKPSVMMTNIVCSGTSSARAYLWMFPI